MKKLLVFGTFTEKQLAQFASVSKEIQLDTATSVENIPGNLDSYDAVIGNVDTDILRKMTHLQWVQLISSGADAFVKDGVLQESTILTCATGAYGIAISEYMIAILLDMMKKIPQYMEAQKERAWIDAGMVTSPMGKRILLVGTGNIGLDFARRMKAFDCHLVGIRRDASICPKELDEVYGQEALKEEVAKADVIAISLPGTEETYHLFDEEMMMACKAGSYLMNVGRGNVVDNEAIAKKEVYQHFDGIWLDVFEIEPLPENSPLYDVPNMIMTPHITGGNHLDYTINSIFEICYDNLKVWACGEGDYRNIVDKKIGYARK